jgi:hypothetical protein
MGLHITSVDHEASLVAVRNEELGGMVDASYDQ